MEKTIIKERRRKIDPIVKKELKATDNIQNDSNKARQRNVKDDNKTKMKISRRNNADVVGKMPRSRPTTRRQMVTKFNPGD